ncbi:FHA domain-containing protein [Nocardia sp. NPDC049526]|uniref:FHA domain-containing protein n=1 Tax=Nocardia sp. NPDC049526 TaxID=3364316 RepID=UPI0037B9AA10
MRNDASTVGIALGDGLIARFGAVVVYLAGETPSTDRILGAIEAVADARHPGAAIAQRLAAVVFGGNSEPPPFGVIAPTADGTVILLRGQVSAEIQGAEGTRRLSGARAFTWVDEIVREPVRRISVGADSAFPIHELPRTDLRGGIVPGSGFVLRIAARRTGKSAATRARTTGTPTAEPPPTAPAGSEALREPTAKSEPTPTGQRVGTPRPARSAQLSASLQAAESAHFVEPTQHYAARSVAQGQSAESPRTAQPHASSQAAESVRSSESTQHSAARSATQGQRPDSAVAGNPARPTTTDQPTGAAQATGSAGATGFERAAGSARPTGSLQKPAARSAEADPSAEKTRRAGSAHARRSPQRSAAEYDGPTEKAGPTGSIHPGRSPQSGAESTAHDEPTEKAGPTGSIHSGRRAQQAAANSAEYGEPTEKAGPTGSTDSGRSPQRSAAQAVGFDEASDKPEPAGSTAAARPGAASSEPRPSGSAPSGGSGPEDAPEDIGTQAMSAQEREEAAGTRSAVAARPEPIALHKIPALRGVRPRPLRPVGGAKNPENSGAGQPVGALVLADGSAFPLDRPYVVGRSPMIDETVRAATATPLAVPRDRHVSRVHAYVSVDRGKVYVRDAATPAGTFIAAPGADEWTRIGTTPTELHPGWSLRIGQRILTYRTEAHPKHPTEATSKRRRS